MREILHLCTQYAKLKQYRLETHLNFHRFMSWWQNIFTLQQLFCHRPSTRLSCSSQFIRASTRIVHYMLMYIFIYIFIDIYQYNTLVSLFARLCGLLLVLWQRTFHVKCKVNCPSLSISAVLETRLWRLCPWQKLLLKFFL